MNTAQTFSGGDRPVLDLPTLLRTMRPVHHPGVYVFASVPAETDLAGVSVISTFREAEGISIIVEEEEARRANLPVIFRAAWITLTVHSDLHAVGLTAAVAAALTAASISCNVVAAVHHDHLFVPVESAARALGCLQTLQQQAMVRSGAGSDGQ